jgi:hypothetical protein
MPVVLTNTGIKFSNNFTQQLAAKGYTQQRYVNPLNVGATTISFTGIPTDSKNIIIAGQMGFSSGPNSPRVEIMTDSTLHYGYYTGANYTNYYTSGWNHSTLSRATSFSNLFLLPTYSETPNFVIELTRTNATSLVEYVYTYVVNTGTGINGNHIVGTGQIGTGLTTGFNKVVIGNYSSNNLYGVDLNVYYK